MTEDDIVSGRPARAVPDRVRQVGGAALVVLALGGYSAERLAADQARASLRACVDRGQASFSYAERRIAGVVEYASPLLVAATTPAAVRTDLEALVQRTAAGALPALDERRQACRRVSSPTWRTGTRRARDAYLRYSATRREAIAALGAGFDSYGTVPRDLAGQRAAVYLALRRELGPDGVDAAWQLGP